MKPRTLALGVMSVMLTATAAHGQRKPDFSGKWVLESDRTQSGGTGGCPPSTIRIGQEVSALQTPAVLTLEYLQGPPGNRQLIASAYKLDGSESKNPISSGESVSRVAWAGQKLTIYTTGVFDTGGGDVPTVTIKTTQVLSLDSGRVFTISTSVSCRGHAPETTTLVYRKKS